MYESYTRQSLPSKEYRELLGTAICVFNSNNAFIIENVLRYNTDITWYELMNKTSGELNKYIKCMPCCIKNLFEELVDMRNRIIHSFQCTKEDGKQILKTKDKYDCQYDIDKEYLYKFIKKNEQLSDMLHDFRGF